MANEILNYHPPDKPKGGPSGLRLLMIAIITLVVVLIIYQVLNINGILH